MLKSLVNDLRNPIKYIKAGVSETNATKAASIQADA